MNPTKEQILECITQLQNRWQCKYGLIHTNPVGPDREPSTLNGVLYTGITYFMIKRAAKEANCALDPNVIFFLASLDQALSDCLTPKYPLPCRTPTNRDQQGPDDYKGLSLYLTSSLGGRGTAYSILKYGEQNSKKIRIWLPKLGRWLNNTDTPDRVFDKLPDNASFWTKLKNVPFAPWGYRAWVQPWMGRFPALTFALRCSTGDVFGFWPTVFSVGSILTQALFGNTKKPDSWYMDWTLIKCHDNAFGESQLVFWASNLWWKRLYKLYPEGMKQVWQQYSKYPDFPLSHFFFDDR